LRGSPDPHSTRSIVEGLVNTESNAAKARFPLPGAALTCDASPPAGVRRSSPRSARILRSCALKPNIGVEHRATVQRERIETGMIASDHAFAFEAPDPRQTGVGKAPRILLERWNLGVDPVKLGICGHRRWTPQTLRFRSGSSMPPAARIPLQQWQVLARG